MKRSNKIIFNIIVALVLLTVIICICSKFFHFGRVEFTDNAQIKQLIVPVNSRVQGFISCINFKEYSYVKKGDTLLVIDDTEYRYRLAQAQAQYQNAIAGKVAMQSSINTTQNNILVSQSGINEAKVRLNNDKTEYERYSSLYNQNAVTKQQYDAVKTNYEASKERYELLLRQSKSTWLVKEEQKVRLNQNEAAIKLAEAAVQLAELNLSYTYIVAPCNGFTGRLNIQIGQLVQPGQVVIDIVDESDCWIVANFKEKQIANIKDGDNVKIKIDAIPNIDYNGVVCSISKATGASYSLIKQDNSSGNFIKIQQRIPVRINFTNENSQQNLALLRAGMNVECEVIY